MRWEGSIVGICRRTLTYQKLNKILTMILTNNYLFNIIYLMTICILSAGCHNSFKETEQNLKLWNDTHTTKDISQLSPLYSDTVLYYGKRLSKNDCIEDKLKLFKRYETYEQLLIGDAKTNTVSKIKKEIKFVKEVKFDGKVKKYPSYLVFEKHASKWLIIEESDSITDYNLARIKKKKIEKVSSIKRIKKSELKGDFNGDGREEELWLMTQKDTNQEKDNSDDWFCTIESNNKKIKAKRIEGCIDGGLNNLGDLDGDGNDEIGLLTMWFQGCWRPYFVFSIKNNKLVELIPQISTHCNMWEEAGQFVEKDPNVKGRLIIKCANDDIDDYNFTGLKIEYINLK